MKRAAAQLLLLALMLGGCAATKENERSRLVAPVEVASVYSEVELQAALALTADAPCRAGGCPEAEAFAARVLYLGERLAPAAAAEARERGLTAPRFDVTVPGKNDIGTLSSASGTVVVFDGIRALELTDPALAFLIAREMGHVLARHHEENSATSIAVSVAVSLLFPVTGLFQSTQAVYATSSVVNASLVSTAASFAGARVIRGIYEDDQRREADEFALAILLRAGWDAAQVRTALQAAAPRLAGGGWLDELAGSRRWLDETIIGPDLDLLMTATMRPEDFGPEFRRETRWLAGLLYGGWQFDGACIARLPAPRAEIAVAILDSGVRKIQKIQKPQVRKAAPSKRLKHRGKPLHRSVRGVRKR